LKEFVLILNVIQGPFNPDADIDVWALLCTVETQDGKKSVEEVRATTFNELYALRNKVELSGPQQIEMEWIDA